ncbi:hypothetical protein IHE45_18G119100 [Dioscorea alata]|uniref:Uncharacterized protein n=1 Tax=Dioscorea alata TaxID=55571 RepID=A0ACB7U9W3_DIOAL|nr:hypothetical protein IHE45_18G119100 [Dioscorea alata]
MGIHGGLNPQARPCLLRSRATNKHNCSLPCLINQRRSLFFSGAARPFPLWSNGGREQRPRIGSTLSTGFEGHPEDEDAFIPRRRRRSIQQQQQQQQEFSNRGDWWRQRKQGVKPPESKHWAMVNHNHNDELMAAASVEWNASRLDMPLSLRIIKRKKIWEGELMEAGEFACCSAKKAFSSMVFMVRELQSHAHAHAHALYMRSDDDQPPLPGILDRVRTDLHASFVWLFQRVFCCTPTLMLYLMILLANFTVYSMYRNPTTAIPPSQSLLVSISDIISTDDNYPSAAQLQDETIKWNKFVEDALRIRASTTDEALMDPDVLRQFVAPVSVQIPPEEDNCQHYINTELMYERALSEDPDNALLLSNFAQFLYLVHHNYDRYY